MKKLFVIFTLVVFSILNANTIVIDRYPESNDDKNPKATLNKMVFDACEKLAKERVILINKLGADIVAITGYEFDGTDIYNEYIFREHAELLNIITYGSIEFISTLSSTSLYRKKDIISDTSKNVDETLKSFNDKYASEFNDILDRLSYNTVIKDIIKKRAANHFDEFLRSVIIYSNNILKHMKTYADVLGYK